MRQPKSAKQIAAAIAKLQAQAEAIERKQGSVIKGIIKQMQASGITIAELRDAMGKGASKKPGKRLAKVKAGVRKKAAIKFSDGQGNTWSGRGRTPVWLMAAEKAGKSRDQFAV